MFDELESADQCLSDQTMTQEKHTNLTSLATCEMCSTIPIYQRANLQKSFVLLTRPH